jgi:hypothetical protein
MEKMNFVPNKNVTLEETYYSKTKEQIETIKKSFDLYYADYVKNFKGGSGDRGITPYLRGMKSCYDSVWLEIKKFRIECPQYTSELSILNNLKSSIEEKIKYLRKYKNSTGLIDSLLPVELADRSTEPNIDAKIKQELRNTQTEELKEKISGINTFLQDRKDSLGNDYYHFCPPRGEAYSPQDFDYTELAVTDPSKSGLYTLNPEEQKVSFEKMEPFAIPLDAALKEKNQDKLRTIKYVVENYGEEYYLPGMEYAKWLYENQDKLPNNTKGKFKNGQKYILPGSIAIGDGGSTRILTLDFQNNEFGNGFRLNLDSIEGVPLGEILLLKQ